MGNQLRGFNSQDPEKNRMQDDIRNTFAYLLDVPFLEGNLIEDMKITTGGTLIEHQLSKEWTGWFIVKQNANAVVWNDTSADEKRYLKLLSSGTVTVSLWVF
jgi:hypothetical protein